MQTPPKNYFIRLLAAIFGLFIVSLSAQALNTTTLPLVTFGNDASPNDGDDNFSQIIFFKIPKSIKKPLYVRIFDPDCGGAWDELGSWNKSEESVGNWNTRTRFSLYGGSGKLIISKSFETDSLTDNHWYTLAKIIPQNGKKVGDYYLFKLLVQGEKGNDGNVFDVIVSSSKLNEKPVGVKLFSYAPTVSIPKKQSAFPEFRFLIPSNTQTLYIRNFDLDRASFWFETPFGSHLPLKASNQGKWVEEKLSVTPAPTQELAALIVKSLTRSSNTLILSVQDQNKVPLSIELPIRLVHHNKLPIPLVKTEFLSDCYSVVFDGSLSQDKDGRVSKYLWDFGDGKSAKGVRVIHKYKELGTYSYQLTVQDNSTNVANRSRKKFQLVLNKSPIADLGGDSTVMGMPAEKLHFSAANSTDADGEIKRFFWDFGDGKTATGINVSHTYQHPGLYQLHLRVEDDSSSPCNFATSTRKVWINTAPIVDAGANKRAAILEDVHFNDSVSFDTDGNIIQYQWDFGDGSQATGKIVSHKYQKDGNYKVTLTVTDNAKLVNSSTSDYLTVAVNHVPEAIASVNTNRAARKESLYFSGIDSFDPDGKIVDWFWDFGDGNKGKGSKIEHTYTDSGTYTVKLTVKDDSGTSSDLSSTKFQVVINKPPIAKAGEDQLLTVSEIHFDGSQSYDPDGSITAWHWNFGDGQQGTGVRTSHIYRYPGIYPVTLTVTDDSGTSSQYHSDSLEVTINAKPVADAGPDRLVIPEEIIPFNAQSSFDGDGKIVNWHWDFGNGDSSDKENPFYAFKQPGVYRVQLRVADDTGHSQAISFDEAIITVNALPIARAGVDIHTVPNELVELDAVGSYDPDGKIKSYQWFFSDGESSANTRKIKRSFTKPGIYTAKLQITDNSGASNSQAEDSLTIYVNHQPVAQIGKEIAKQRQSCSHILSFDASNSSDADGDPLHYRWDFGDGTPIQSGVIVNHTYIKAGKYPVTLEVDDGTGLANATHITSQELIINHPPVANAGKNRQSCAGEVVLLDASQSYDPDGGKLKYSWNLDGMSLDGLNPIYTFKKAGIYPIKLTVEDDSGLQCNTDSTQFLVKIAEAPIANAGKDQTVCTHTPVYFDGRGSYDSDGVVNAYDWDFGDNSKTGGATPTHLYESPGIYTVNLTITGDKYGTCANVHSDNLIVKVIAAPTAILSAPREIPVGETTKFSATQSGTRPISQRLWDFGDGQYDEGEVVEHRYTKPGVYLLKLTLKDKSQNLCNQSVIQQQITVNAPPVAVAGENQQVLLNQVVFFDASASSDPDGVLSDYQWDFGDGQTGSGYQVRHQYNKAGLYTVKLRVKDNLDLSNSYNEDTLQVQVYAPPKVAIQLSKPAYCVGESVIFDTISSETRIKRWQWYFGDGETAKGKKVTHTYSGPGLYTSRLEIDDGSSLTNKNQLVRINQPPQAEIRAKQQVCLGEKVTFDASSSYDPDGHISAYQWQFGENDQGKGKKVSHIFKQTGLHKITLQIRDNSGSICQTATSVRNIKVNNPPVAEIKLSDEPFFSGGAHDAILFDASNSIDVDADKLKYTWHFGDGNRANGKQVFHAYNKPGNYTVRLQVQDDSGTDCDSNWDKRMIHVIKR